MKEMYKDNAGNWHYGCKGEKLTEVSYSTNSVPDSIPIEWIKKWSANLTIGDVESDRTVIEEMLRDWEKENE